MLLLLLLKKFYFEYNVKGGKYNPNEMCSIIAPVVCILQQLLQRCIYYYNSNLIRSAGSRQVDPCLSKIRDLAFRIKALLL